MRTSLDNERTVAPPAPADGPLQAQGIHAGPRVHGQQQTGIPLTTAAQPDGQGEPAQLTSAPALQASSSSDQTEKASADAQRYREQAGHGDIRAQHALGLMYYEGDGAEEDVQQAFAWFGKAAQAGYAPAQFHLGVMYLDGEGTQAQPDLAIEWIGRAAEQGHVDAQHELGEIYAHGRGVKRDSSLAFSWFSKAAFQGDARSQCLVGLMYQKGKGVKRDLEQSFSWFSKAALQGNVEAELWLGLLYYMGNGVAKDMDQAFLWLDKAREKGSAQAHYWLGRMYWEGRSVARDEEKAFEYFNWAAHHDDDAAQRQLGTWYCQGIHVRQDLETGLQWLLRSAGWGRPDVTTLRLSGCGIDDTLLAAIMAHLPADAMIETLDFGDNLIGNEGAARLAAMLDRCPTLTELDLDNNPITKPGISALAQAMRGNTTVTKLSVKSSIKPGAAGKAELGLIEAECASNRRIAALLRQQKSWKAYGWNDFTPKLVSLLEQSLIRTDIKLHDSDSTATKRRLLEMQLCLSTLARI